MKLELSVYLCFWRKYRDMRKWWEVKGTLALNLSAVVMKDVPIFEVQAEAQARWKMGNLLATLVTLVMGFRVVVTTMKMMRIQSTGNL